MQPLVELRTPFILPRSMLDDVDRGRPDPDLSVVIEAGHRAALAEDRIVSHGFKAAGITGVVESSPHGGLEISDDYGKYPMTVAQAAAKLRAAGVHGPYAIALGDRCHTGVIETTEYGGYPGSRAHPPHPRRLRRVGAGGRRSGGAQRPGRRLRAELWTGFRHRLPGPKMHPRSGCTWESIGFQVIMPEAAVPLVYR